VGAAAKQPFSGESFFMTLDNFSPSNVSLSELHVVIREDFGVVFHADTLAFFKVNLKTAHILRDIENGVSPTDCAERYGLSVAEIEKFLENLQDEIVKQAQTRPPKIYNTELLGERLILLVSQDCNLRCLYCNASGGDYNQGRGLMSPETAIQTIDSFILDGDFLFQGVQFFGGEPTLNLPTVLAVCQHLTRLHEEGRIAHLPWFTLITNGMLVSDEFVQIVKKYGIKVTFSIDGPQSLHDHYRINVGGQGTYQRIVKGLKKLREATNGKQPEAVEATVTRRHLDEGFTYSSLQKFFVDELGFQRTHLALIESGYDEVGWVSDQERTQWLVDAQASVIQNLALGKPEASILGLRLLKKLVFKHISPYLCPVGIAALTVNANGSIYPCYQLMDSSFYMGQSKEKEVWKTAVYQQVEQRMRENDKFHHPQCKLCWARGVCSGCLGELYARTGSIEQRIDAVCDGIRNGVEEVLCGLAKLHSTPSAWKQVLHDLKLSKEYSNANNTTELY